VERRHQEAPVAAVLVAVDVEESGQRAPYAL
jgi:hypothetical protein